MTLSNQRPVPYAVTTVQGTVPYEQLGITAGFSDHVARATDMAEAELYRFIGGGAGLASLPGEIRNQLTEKGIPEDARKQMLDGNIARRLAGIN